MYNGRDMTKLQMMSTEEWTDGELKHFHFSLQQITPYLNEEGKTIQKEIIKEIEQRGGIGQLQ